VYILVGEDDAKLMAGDKVLVENGNCQEVGSLRKFEAAAHLNHPVDHLGPVLLGDIMANEGLSGSSHDFFLEELGVE
jgi:hypothetical protein